MIAKTTMTERTMLMTRDELFGVPAQRRKSRSNELDPKDILLGSDFENDVLQDISNNEESRASPIPSLQTKSAPWPAFLLPTDIAKIVREIKTLTVRVPSASGVDEKVEIGTREVKSFRGTGESFLKWLDDVTIARFVHLVNQRSKRFMINIQGSTRELHKPSEQRDVFLKTRVPFHILTHSSLQSGTDNKMASTLLSRSGNVKSKTTHLIGVFMIPALVNGSHWVLAVVDVDGRQLLYYDPYRHPDKYGVLDCARGSVAGELSTAKKSM